MDDLRSIEIKTGDSWEAIDFRLLMEGDRFRMFEPTGEAVVGSKGDTEFICMSTPYLIDGVWGVDIGEGCK